jgi:hypothetical protein
MIFTNDSREDAGAQPGERPACRRGGAPRVAIGLQAVRIRPQRWRVAPADVAAPLQHQRLPAGLFGSFLRGSL